MDQVRPHIVKEKGPITSKNIGAHHVSAWIRSADCERDATMIEKKAHCSFAVEPFALGA